MKENSKPDVATLALAGDTDALHGSGNLIPKDWQKRLLHNSSPYTSTIVLVVHSLSILAEPAVTIVDKKGTRSVA